MEVIFKEGMLYLQGAKFGKKTWRKVWVMLFKPSSTGVGRLELYTIIDNNTDLKRATRQKTPDRKVVRLSDCLSITPAPKESCPQGCTAFYLNTAQSNYTLASTTSQDWLSALCLLAFQKDPGESDKGSLESGNGLTMEDNDLYSSWKTDVTLPPNQYQVTIQSTDASRRCKLAGEYLVSAEKEAVVLLACNSGHILYRWPYQLLRKFGQAEGEFSIEAGRRCESGEGVFIFLSRHSTEIFQTILEQCSVKKNSSVESLKPVHKQSPATKRHPVCNTGDASVDTEDESEDHYSTVTDISLLNLKQLSYFSNSKEAVGEEGEDKDMEEQCHSLESLKLDDSMDDCIYYNLRRSTPPPIRKDHLKPEADSSECIYSDLRINHSPSNSQLQLYSSPVPQPDSQSPPCVLPLVAPSTPPKPRYQRQPPVNIFNQPGFSAQAQAAADTTEMEEAISSSSLIAPTEAPGSFKHRLAEIISKDLAKLQPPLPPGMGSPTFSQ